MGRIGEAMAARHLESKGWTIVARNVRKGREEVDLVAKRGNVLAFVEVKTRRGSGFGHPLESINRDKRRGIARVTRRWLQTAHPPAGTVVRFDAVAVARLPGGRWAVEHVPDAWRMQ